MTANATVHVTVRFFAQLRSAVGVSDMQVSITAGSSVRNLADALEAQYEGLSLRGSMCAVNEAYAEPDMTLDGGETVAFLPPVSGG